MAAKTKEGAQNNKGWEVRIFPCHSENYGCCLQIFAGKSAIGHSLLLITSHNGMWRVHRFGRELQTSRPLTLD